MKSIKSMVFGIAMCIAASFAYSAAEKQEIQFLPYYDSLNDKVGQPGHWFVRDAAGTTTGQHGDPTVRKGWAIYTWNQRAKNNRPGWTKICEEESLDSSASEQLYLKYVSKAQFAEAMQSVSNDFVKVSKYNTDMAGVNSSIKTLDLRTQGLVTKVRDLTSTVSNVSEAADTALARADAAIEGITAHETWAKAMSNNVLTSAMAYTDEKCKGGGIGTNVVKEIAKDLDTTLSNNLVKVISDGDTTVYSKATSYADTNTLVRAYAYTDSATNETLIAANAYTDSKCTGVDTNVVKDIARELDEIVITNANLYTDGVATKLSEAIKDGDTNTLELAKIDANANLDAAVKIINGTVTNISLRVVDLEGKIVGVYHFKGVVATTNDLPETATNADVYYVTNPGESYVWIQPMDSEPGVWKPMGKDFDLSGYKTWIETEQIVNEKVEIARTNAIEVSKKYTDAAFSSLKYTRNIKATADIGIHKVDAKTGYVELELAGKTLQEGMEYLTVEVKEPTSVEYPKITEVTLSGAGAKEVGTSFTPSYTVKVNTGNYTYDKTNTGVEYDLFVIYDGVNDDKRIDSTNRTQTGSFSSFYVLDDTNYRVSAKAHHKKGNLQHNNQGAVNTNEALRIQERWCQDKGSEAAASVVSSSAVTGYRVWYAYVGTSTATIDSEFLTKTAKKQTNAKSVSTKNITINKGDTRVVIALPAYNATLGYKRELTKVIDSGGFGHLDVFEKFSKMTGVTVSVSSVVADMNYNVWVYEKPDGFEATNFDLTFTEVPAPTLLSTKLPLGQGKPGDTYESSGNLLLNLYRQYKNPLDSSSVFYSTNDLAYYTTTGRVAVGLSPYWVNRNANPYDGQIVTLSLPNTVTTNYMLTAKEDGEFDMTPMATGYMVDQAYTSSTNYATTAMSGLYSWIINTLVPFIRTSDDQILVRANEYTDGYTSWEVWPHASDNNLTERFYVRTSEASLQTVECSDGELTLALPKSNNGCFIIWGDGSSRQYLRTRPDFSKITKDQALKIYRQDEWISGQDWIIYVAVEHTYPSSDDKKYIIQVGGGDFFCIYKRTLDASYPMNSLMSRVFDSDLTIAHNHNNFCCFAAQAPYLTKVHFPHGFDTPWVKNWSSIFVNSSNLVEVLNIDCAARNAKNIGSMFMNCVSLTNTDFRINGHCVYEATSIFNGCTNLEVDILKLLPSNGFADQYVNIGSTFKDCKKLYIGTTSTNKVAQMLWCNNLVQWISTSGCFAGCSPELRSVVPKSWGGTAKDIISSTAKGATVINNYPTYPNRVNGPFNVALGIDNEVGFKSAGSSYSVAIGTSNKAEKQHSYAWGSQLNALSENSVTVGYGLTANDKQSTVIGFGNRSIADRTFANYAAMTNFFSQGECTNEVFVGYGVLCENGPGCSHIVDEVFEEPDTTTGMYVTLRSGPYDIEVGKRRWYYGKSHGVGTTTIVAIGDSVNDYGLANVYINDRSLANWTGVNVGQPTDKEVYNKGIFGPETSHCDHDYTIAIGDNAKAVETASSCQAVAIGRDALSAGSATVAVGPNSFAIGAQAVAVGWRANAVGAHSVAIGCAKKSGEDYYKDGTINTNSDLCVAEGSESVAIGFNAKARATGSVQIGTGTNNVPNTLKFQDITLVEGGKIVGSFDPKELDPRIHHFGTNVNPTADEIYVNCRPHVINTVTFDKPVDGGSEMYLVPEGSRNYKVFLPNRANLREGLPIALETEIDSKPTVLFNEGNKWCFKLPVMIDVKQPIEDTIIFENKHLEDSWDWTPGITNCAIICTNVTTAAKFVTQGSYSLKGTNLHAAVAFQLVYPTTATTTLTNNLAEVSAKDGFITGTLYYSAPSIELIPPQPIHFEGDTSWFEIIYKTTHGDAQVIRKTINVLD